MPRLIARTRERIDPDLVKRVAVLNEDELRSLLDEAQGASRIPLAELVIEGLSADVCSLAKRLGDLVVLDDIGRRCCTRDTARRLFEEKAAADKRRAEMAARNRARAVRNQPAIREHVQAVRERQAATGDYSLNVEPDPWHNR
jgi:hypothetical protein